MRLPHFMLGTALAFMLLAGCQQRVVERYTPEEAPHYTQWEQETHRSHVDYDKRSQDEKSAYWNWRHHH